MQHSHNLTGRARISGEGGNLAVGSHPAFGDTFNYFLDSLFKCFRHFDQFFLSFKIRQFQRGGYCYFKRYEIEKYSFA